ncbi:MAG: prepilin-type N-terminal cleavage/methylation domain-containing protein [Candidatus Brocadiia bacterium]
MIEKEKNEMVRFFTSHKRDGQENARLGFTLVEILIAIGILAVGMMGICAIFPLAIRNVTTAKNRYVADSIGRSAIVSLKQYSLHLSDGYGRGQFSNGKTKTLGDQPWDNMCAALHDFCSTETRGHGNMNPTFQIYPDAVHTDSDLDGSDYVKCPENPDYGWTATLTPVPFDDDGDGKSDENGPAPGDDPYAENGIKQDTNWNVQVAVWRNYKIEDDSGSATFTQDSQWVEFTTDPDWDEIRAQDYLRSTEVGIWYRIAAIDQSNSRVRLVRAFKNPTLDDGGQLTGHTVEIASRHHLVALYSSTINP